ncbi:glycoside hydrolase family 3 C-terminal domain-containing protein [Galbibacter pacificus]|uniref:Glycoside hydrolase family 3 C-terminal domain-containing protein n=1 Tax=Galbibacter pacificus TaxID=2996052 RepID=A0ABT6FMR8_9FLAO|nr:glycoside hydrolase family 3 C-terminal domain-containing protein [Galbibacter pacificus]MDG3581072.1 glycoside hydrolase family 3 C-terminal domain-containing protein [Galbibacter pacificus]MDG3584550.1 glycoside hydrolase family 3 C-terminal domain-containing protein [Galbibacter pacificus]
MKTKLLIKRIKFIKLISFLVLILFFLNGCQKKKSTRIYKDFTKDFSLRVNNLLSYMTLEEKVGMLRYDNPGVPRLGIPRYNWWNECLHGVARAGEATVFPQAIGLASSFDERLMKEVATVISDEARAKHQYFKNQGVRGIYSGLTFWSPNINIFRDPRWGRGQETYGEDPYLTSRMGVNFIQGLQGDNPKYLKLVATAKHFAVHNGPEISRHSDDFDVSDKDLNETYLPAFDAAVNEANVQSIMCAYNAFRGVPCCANNLLLDSVLRKKWKFNGYVVSDCGAISDFYREGAHEYVSTKDEAASVGIKSGTDLNCGDVYQNLDAAIKKGLVDTTFINKSVKKLLTTMFKLGMFDPDSIVPYTQISIDEVANEKHIDLSRKAAQESIVLLKNKMQALPLSKKIKSIAVIGPNANSLDALYGNYHGISKNPITPVKGIQEKLAKDAAIYYAPGTPYVDGMNIYQDIPEQVFYVDSTLSRRGLQGKYYKSLDYTGTPALDRVDKKMDFNWMDKMPIELPYNSRFSIIWKGILLPEYTGKYKFKTRGEVFVDGKKVDGEISLKSGVKYNFEFRIHGNQMYDETIVPAIKLLWARTDYDYAQEALDVAKKAEVVIFCGGLSPRIEGEEMGTFKLEGFEYGDRSLLKLPDVQTNLLKRMNALGKKIIYVNMSGSAVAFNWVNKYVNGIIQVFYPGEQGGNALADVLFGDYNPSGRLPITFYKSVDDLGDFKDYSMKGKTYRYFEGSPLYPFGYGLSYSKFKYSDLVIEQDTSKDEVTLSVKVTNNGHMDGEEVVQVYMGNNKVIGQPIRSLKAFKRVSIPKNQSVKVEFVLTGKSLKYIDQYGISKPISGEVELTIGGGYATINENYIKKKLEIK